MLRDAPKQLRAASASLSSMNAGPPIARVAHLIGDPARANMLSALMSGKALTASELTRAAGVTAQTASGHLAKLQDGGLVLCAQQGRHRYFRLAAPEIADVLESLMSVAVRQGPSDVRTGPSDAALRRARVCYDHLAGEAGVALVDGLAASGRLLARDGGFSVPAEGRRFFCAFGVDMDRLEAQRRPVCRACLDWSERRPHLGGGLGAALLEQFLAKGWMRRVEGSKALFVTPKGRFELARLHGGSTIPSVGRGAA
jgi:DNA-binding transcriptional ArsR family regulator